MHALMCLLSVHVGPRVRTRRGEAGRRAAGVGRIDSREPTLRLFELGAGERWNAQRNVNIILHGAKVSGFQLRPARVES